MQRVIQTIVFLVPYILIGTVLEFIVAMIQPVRKKKNISILKTVVIAFMLTVIGATGCFIMFRIENGTWGGGSAFGGVFLTPIMIIPLVLMQIDYRTLSDIFVTCGCSSLILLKIDCILTGCCKGMLIYHYNVVPNEISIYFPSRLADILTAFILLIVMLKMQKKESNHGKLYGYFFIMYGICRFVLNFFRLEKHPIIGPISFGQIWPVVSVIAGIIWLIVVNKLNEKNEKTEALKSE